MKTILLFFATFSIMLANGSTQSDSLKHKGRPEVSSYFCAGYFSDNSGNGYYTYSEVGLKTVKKNHLIGGIIGMANVGCLFNEYRYKDLEFLAGLNYTKWGKTGKNAAYYFSLSSCLKHFSDYGHDGFSGNETWQKDWGAQVNACFNFSDEKNRPFHNLKLNLQGQAAFWSKREGTSIDQGYVTDRVNFKAVNRSYFKAQLESAVKKISLGAKGKFEPKIVVGYLYDNGSQKSMYESGAGVALSFMKKGRYYEAFNIQYRARFGKEFSNKKRLDLVELGLDPINLYRMIFE